MNSMSVEVNKAPPNNRVLDGFVRPRLFRQFGLRHSHSRDEMKVDELNCVRKTVCVAFLVCRVKHLGRSADVRLPVPDWKRHFDGMFLALITHVCQILRFYRSNGDGNAITSKVD